MSGGRCRWCGCFVARGTEPTTRTVKGGQRGSDWHTATQLLCPSCAAVWSTDTPWNRAAEVSREAVAGRGDTP